MLSADDLNYVSLILHAGMHADLITEEVPTSVTQLLRVASAEVLPQLAKLTAVLTRLAATTPESSS